MSTIRAQEEVALSREELRVMCKDDTLSSDTPAWCEAFGETWCVKPQPGQGLLTTRASTFSKTRFGRLF